MVEPVISKPNRPAQHRQRHGQHDHGRVDPAFELGGQHQEDQQQGQAEGDADGAGGFQEVLGLAAPLDADARGGMSRGLVLEELHRVPTV
jgi:hypothetical protein